MWYRTAEKEKSFANSLHERTRIREEIAEVARSLNSGLMPGYGDCQWNPETKTVYWNFGDGDEWSDDEMKAPFLKIKGVKDVKLENEGPRDLGDPWITVDWREHKVTCPHCHATFPPVRGHICPECHEWMNKSKPKTSSSDDDLCHKCGKAAGKWQYYCRICLPDIEHQQLDELGVCPRCGVKYSDDCTHCERCGYKPGEPRPKYEGVKD